jgi:hypothetical protein
MSEQQAISAGLEALKLIAAGGIGAAIIGVIGKLVVDRKLQEQKYEYDKQIEPLKSELQRKNTIHKLQFEKEFQLCEELWKALVDVRSSAIITPTVDIMPKGKSPYDVYKERFENAVDAFNKANNLFEYHRPFYHDDVSKITGDLLSQCRGYIRGVGQTLKSENFDEELHDKADELLKKVPKAIDEIEKVIKRRIGLLQEAEIVE